MYFFEPTKRESIFFESWFIYDILQIEKDMKMELRIKRTQYDYKLDEEVKFQCIKKSDRVEITVSQ